MFTSWTTDYNDVSSAKKFALLVKLSNKPFRKIKNSNGSRIDRCRPPAWAMLHDKFWLLSTTLCFLLLKKSDKMQRSSPEMLFCFNLKISPSCQTLSKVFDMSNRTVLTSNPLSKEVKTL